VHRSEATPVVMRVPELKLLRRTERVVDVEALKLARLHGRINRSLVSAGDRRNARHRHLEHRMPDAVRITAIRHRFGDPPAHTKLALHLPQEQQAGIGRRVAAVKINCEFLAPDAPCYLDRRRTSLSHHCRLTRAFLACRWAPRQAERIDDGSNCFVRISLMRVDRRR
jgi:hypothetical protein